MAEEIIIADGVSKTEKYEALIPQLKSLVESEPDVIANMANISAALKEVFGFFWVGFYIVRDKQLVLGPFQGPIVYASGMEGAYGIAWKAQKPIIVPNVDEFPDHIACSSCRNRRLLFLFSVRKNSCCT